MEIPVFPGKWKTKNQGCLHPAPKMKKPAKAGFFTKNIGQGLPGTAGFAGAACAGADEAGFPVNS